MAGREGPRRRATDWADYGGGSGGGWDYSAPGGGAGGGGYSRPYHYNNNGYGAPEYDYDYERERERERDYPSAAHGPRRHSHLQAIPPRPRPRPHALRGDDASTASGSMSNSPRHQSQQPPPPPSSEYESTPPPPPGAPPTPSASKRRRTSSPEGGRRRSNTTRNPSDSHNHQRSTTTPSALSVRPPTRAQSREEGEVVTAAHTPAPAQPPLPPPPPASTMHSIDYRWRPNQRLREAMADLGRGGVKRVDPQPPKPVVDRQIGGLVDAIQRQVTTEAALAQARSLLAESLQWIEQHPEDQEYFEASERKSLETAVTDAERAHRLARNEVMAKVERLVDTTLDFSLECSKIAFGGANAITQRKLLIIANEEQTEFRDNFKKIAEALQDAAGVSDGPLRGRPGSRGEGNRTASHSKSPARSRAGGGADDSAIQQADQQDISMTDIVHGQPSSRSMSPINSRRARSSTSAPAPAQDEGYTITQTTTAPAPPQPSRSAIASSIHERIAELHEIIDARMEELREAFTAKLSDQVRDEVHGIVLRNREKRIEKQRRTREAGGEDEQETEAAIVDRATGSRPDTPREQSLAPPPRSDTREPSRAREESRPREQQSQRALSRPISVVDSPLPPADEQSAGTPASSGDFIVPLSVPREMQRVLHSIHAQLLDRIETVRQELESARKVDAEDLNNNLQQSFNLVSDQFQAVDATRQEEVQQRNARFEHLERENEKVKAALRTAMQERRFLHEEILTVKRDLQARERDLQTRDQINAGLVRDMQNLVQVVNGLAAHHAMRTAQPPPPPQQQQGGPAVRNRRSPSPARMPHGLPPRPPQPSVLRPAVTQSAQGFGQPAPQQPLQQQQQQQQYSPQQHRQQPQPQPQTQPQQSQQQQQSAWNVSRSPVALPPPRFAGQAAAIPPPAQQGRPAESSRLQQTHAPTQAQAWQAAAGHVQQPQLQRSSNGPSTPGPSSTAGTAAVGAGTPQSPIDVDAVVARVTDAAQEAGLIPTGSQVKLSRDQLQKLLSTQPNAAGRIESTAGVGGGRISDADLEQRIRWLVEQQASRKQTQDQQRQERTAQLQQQQQQQQQQGQSENSAAAHARAQALAALDANPQLAQHVLMQQRSQLQQQQQQEANAQQSIPRQANQQGGPTDEEVRNQVLTEIDALLPSDQTKPSGGDDQADQPVSPATTGQSTTAPGSAPQDGSNSNNVPNGANAAASSSPAPGSKSAFDSRATLNALVTSMSLLTPAQRDQILSQYSSVANPDGEHTEGLAAWIGPLMAQFGSERARGGQGRSPAAEVEGQEKSPAAEAEPEQPETNRNGGAAPANDADVAEAPTTNGATVTMDADDEAEIDELVSTPPLDPARQAIVNATAADGGETRQGSYHGSAGSGSGSVATGVTAEEGEIEEIEV